MSSDRAKKDRGGVNMITQLSW